MIEKNELYETTVAPTNIKRYKQFYTDINIGDKINVTGDQLPDSSHIKIKYICDFCGVEYERMKYSEIRSGKEFNACKNCRNKKIQLTCQEKYGTNHPMQNPEVHRRSVEGHINNFGKEYNSCNFVNGIPISKVQKQISEKLIGFTLNYLENGYYYDMFNPDLNLVIEYNGKGHDLQVRFGKITPEEFQRRENIRTESICKNHNLIIINDPYDRLIHSKRFQEFFPQICQAVENLEKYCIIQIK